MSWKAPGAENWPSTILLGANGLIMLMVNLGYPNLRFSCPPMHGWPQGELPEWASMAERGGEQVCMRLRNRACMARNREVLSPYFSHLAAPNPPQASRVSWQ